MPVTVSDIDGDLRLRIRRNGIDHSGNVGFHVFLRITARDIDCLHLTLTMEDINQQRQALPLCLRRAQSHYAMRSLRFREQFNQCKRGELRLGLLGAEYVTGFSRGYSENREQKMGGYPPSAIVLGDRFHGGSPLSLPSSFFDLPSISSQREITSPAEYDTSAAGKNHQTGCPIISFQRHPHTSTAQLLCH